MVIIETDALPAYAMRIAGQALWRYVGASQSGRLGTEIVVGKSEAGAVRTALREYGYTAW